MADKIGILMAAGLGSRMRPITNTIPKPLVSVQGIPLIETVIEGLESVGITQIYIVVGYLQEQFGYLKSKYSNVEIVVNEEYQIKNNISSLRALGDVLGSADCYICEADLFLQDKSVLAKVGEQSCYFAKRIVGVTDDWVFQVKDGRIIRVGKGGKDTYGMVGISWWTKEDALIVREAIEVAYEQEGHEQLFWDEIVDRELARLNVGILEVEQDDIIEIDTVEELCELDSGYTKYLSK